MVQAITWNKVDQVLRYHMVSLAQNKWTCLSKTDWLMYYIVIFAFYSSTLNIITVMQHEHHNISNYWQSRLFVQQLTQANNKANVKLCITGPLSGASTSDWWIPLTRDQGAVSIRKTVLPGMAIPMLKIRRPNGRLIFNMEITIRR